MRNKELVDTKQLIVGDDKSVEIQPKNGISILDYINYLVTCMTPNGKDSDIIGSARYTLVVNDDFSGEFGGPYFKIWKVETTQKQLNSLDTYEIDVGFPGADIVTGFSIDDDQTYSILYNYSKEA